MDRELDMIGIQSNRESSLLAAPLPVPIFPLNPNSTRTVLRTLLIPGRVRTLLVVRAGVVEAKFDHHPLNTPANSVALRVRGATLRLNAENANTKSEFPGSGILVFAVGLLSTRIVFCLHELSARRAGLACLRSSFIGTLTLDGIMALVTSDEEQPVGLMCIHSTASFCDRR